MIFFDEKHKQFYLSKQKECVNDVYTRALIYTLGMCETTRLRFDKIYDIKQREINLDQLWQPWQTGTSKKVTRLAFNLYTNTTPTAYSDTEDITEDNFNECKKYSVSDIFCCEYAPYFVQAIKVRYPEYFTKNI